MASSMAKLALVFFLAFVLFVPGAVSTQFTLSNNCPYTVWPGILTGGDSPALSSTGFELTPGATLTLAAPPNWSGRMWARLECSTDSSGRFSCASGDCGSGQVECNGAGGAPPVSLAEFTLNGADGKDFYDTSLVDGFNAPVSIVPQGGGCSSSTCAADVNALCPAELQLRDAQGRVVGCKSACLAFGEDQYCCTGAFNSPNTCKPTDYSRIFKNACPQAYSYPYDDATSTFTCIGANYLITFCP